MLKKLVSIFDRQYPPYQLAIFIGTSTLVGFLLFFSALLLTGGLYFLSFALIAIMYFIFCGEIIAVLLVCFITGLLGYFILKILSFFKFNYKTCNIITGIIAIFCLIIGFFSYPHLHWYLFNKGKKGHVWKIDINRDGKTDKWVHDTVSGTVDFIDYDTNFNGSPDKREFYKDNKIIKTEYLDDNQK